MAFLLHPAVDTTVAQCVVRSEQTGEFFMSQSHPESDGSESVRISRMSSSGVFLDEMMCTGGGHGTSIALSTINGKVQIWMPWQVGGFGSPRQNDLVRFEYQAGTFHRDDLSSLVVQIAGPTLRYVTFDYTGGYAMVRTPTSTDETYERYDLTLWQANDTQPPQFTQTINIGTTTTQGFCTYEDAFYRYSGGANAPSGDTQKLVEYSWASGAAVRTMSTVGLGKDSSGNWIGGRAEPEGSTLFAGGGRPRLYLGVTTGPVGGPHSYYLWLLSLMTKAEMIAAATTTPTGTTTAFTYGQTEPTYGNTGAGTLAAAPTLAYTGSLAPTASVTISNRIITGIIKPGGSGVTITLVNCIVRLDPEGLTSDTRALTATGNGKIVAQFCDITATGASLWVNGAGTKNITLDRCYVYNVVDGVDSLGGVTLRGCLIEKLLRLADPSDASGVTHNDGVQIVGGAGHTIFGCAIHAFNSPESNVPSLNNVATSTVMLTPNSGAVTGVSITYNWLYGGDYPVNGLNLDRATGNSGEIAFNRFGSLAGQTGHTIDLAAGQDNIKTHDNVYLGGGPVTVYRGGTGTTDSTTTTAIPSGTTTNPTPTPTSDPTTTSGTQPTGSGIKSISSLSGSTLGAKINSAGGTNYVSFPQGVFSFNNFAYGTQTISHGAFAYGLDITAAKGLLGAGAAATIIQMTPYTSNKAGDVPPDGTFPNTNNLTYIWATVAGFKVDGVTILGTSQGHQYSGLRYQGVSNPVLSNSVIKNFPGDSGSPPGETTGVDFQRTTGTGVISNVVVDGGNIEAIGLASNSCAGAFSVTNYTAKNCRYSAGWASWQQSGNMVFKNFRTENTCRGFNAERLSGDVTFIDPVWNDPFSGHYDINYTWESGYVGGSITFKFTSASAWDAFIANRTKKKITMVCNSHGNGNLVGSVRVYVGGVQQTTSNYVTFTGS